MRLHVATPLSEHLEIETYSWDVLPAHLETGDIVDHVTRELTIVRQLLMGQTSKRTKTRTSFSGCDQLQDVPLTWRPAAASASRPGTQPPPPPV